MQGLARFSLVAVIILVAVLLGTWAYLTARYGSVEEFMASDDAPRYWQPIRSEAHDDEPVESDGRSLTEKTADAVKAGKIPEGEYGGWRKVEPEKTPDEKPSSRAEAAPLDTIEARIDTAFSDLAIDTDEGTLKRGDSKSSLKPFFARTRPSSSNRPGYTSSRAYSIASSKGGADSPELQELQRRGYTLIRGKVVDNQKLEGIENVVVAPVFGKGDVDSLRAITNSSGEFVLYLPEDAAKESGATEREAKLCVIADGRNPTASRLEKYQFNSEADANGVHLIKLEKSRGLRVRVRVANPRPIEAAVRVWCELRDDNGATSDDHIFMSVIAPPKGDIVFRMPRGHLGQVRVGACGDGWAADAVETDKLSKDLVNVQVTLRPARTSLCKGVVCANWFEDGQAGDTMAAARVAAVGSTDATYTDVDGRFEFFARLDSDDQSLRITTVYGFSRTYSLELRQKSDEEQALVRSQFDVQKQCYEWQFLVPSKVALNVVLDMIDDSKHSMWLHPVPMSMGPPQLSKEDRFSELWFGGVGAVRDKLDYSFKSVAWGVCVFILYKRESSSKFEPLGTYTCDAEFWSNAEVTLTYPVTRGRCEVTVRMPITRN